MRKVEGRNGLKMLELNLRVTMAAIFGLLIFNLEMFVRERDRERKNRYYYQRLFSLIMNHFSLYFLF